MAKHKVPSSLTESGFEEITTEELLKRYMTQRESIETLQKKVEDLKELVEELSILRATLDYD